MKILIVKRDKLGDVVLTTPMISLLRQRFPNATIDILAPKFTLPIINANLDLSARYPLYRVRLSSLRSIVSYFVVLFKIRRQRYDWVIAAGGEYSPRLLRLACSTKGKKVIGYCPIECRNLFKKLTHALVPPHSGHEAHRILALSEPVLASSVKNAEVVLYYFPDRETRVRAARFLAIFSLNPFEYSVICLGARKPKRKPSTAQILDWRAYLWTHYGLKTVICWTPPSAIDPGYPSDSEQMAQLTKYEKNLISCGGSLSEALGVLYWSRLTIAPDSGFMHVGSASPGSLIGLFADTMRSPSPEQWGPIGSSSRLIVAENSISNVDNSEIFNLIDELMAESPTGFLTRSN